MQQFFGCDATRRQQKNILLTKLRELLLVAVLCVDLVLGGFGLFDALLEGDEPAISLDRGLCLEGVLVAMELEEEGNGAILAQIGCLRLLTSALAKFYPCKNFNVRAYQVEDTGRCLLLLGVLDEKEKALSGLA
jgi:hypothetical protein